MNELVQRGHLFIAQPPLYRVKRGKVEKYLKDDAEFTEFIMASALQGVEVRSADGVVKAADELRKVLLDIRKVHTILAGFSADHCDPAVVLAAARIEDLNTGVFNDRALLEITLGKIKSVLGNGAKGVDGSVIIAPENSEAGNHLVIKTRTKGVERTTTLSRSLVSRSDFALLRATLKEVAKLGTAPYRVLDLETGKDIGSCADSDSVFETMDARGRKGFTITRYKGLGEMNPDQLWETTMNPENRVMVQVKIEDAIEADEIFTVLMGDEVEPRRKFIEDNALKIRNLDI